MVLCPMQSAKKVAINRVFVELGDVARMSLALHQGSAAK